MAEAVLARAPQETDTKEFCLCILKTVLAATLTNRSNVVARRRRKVTDRESDAPVERTPMALQLHGLMRQSFPDVS